MEIFTMEKTCNYDFKIVYDLFHKIIALAYNKPMISKTILYTKQKILPQKMFSYSRIV